MCGIAGIIGETGNPKKIGLMLQSLLHRGPDAKGVYEDDRGQAALGSVRLSILDLSNAGKMPMLSENGRYVIVYNGEIYNYLELKKELSDYHFISQTDTEVVLAAFQKWGERCLDRFVGMFAFLIWDKKEQRLFAARDRFGVKPLFYATDDRTLYLASEIKALHAAGIEKKADHVMWATYFCSGSYQCDNRTFWEGIRSLPAGHMLFWQRGSIICRSWYDLADHVANSPDNRPLEEVKEEYLHLLKESVCLRFRSDVPVGINLSGGLDSSMLLGLVDAVGEHRSDVRAFTYVTGDPRYDEDVWVKKMLEGKKHPWFPCILRAGDVPAFAAEVQCFQDEPFGGIPTLAYAKVFAAARAQGTLVLLDGQGMDEQWAGYDYYREAQKGLSTKDVAVIQGTKQRLTRPECLTEEFRGKAAELRYREPFEDAVQNVQYRDIVFTKLPRALRFSDRVSMQFSTELREPFLDHRLLELAFSQPADRKIRGHTGKWLLREIARDLLPTKVAEAPKRPLQTPQREWLRGDLKEWAEEMIQAALTHQPGDWLKRENVELEWEKYVTGESDNSFYVWQWINLGLVVGSSSSSQL